MLDDVMPIIGLVILCGSLGLSPIGWLRGRRMNRFRQARRLRGDAQQTARPALSPVSAPPRSGLSRGHG